MGDKTNCEQDAEYERFVKNIGKPNTPKVEQWLGSVNGDDFFDLEYDPSVFGEQPASAVERVCRVFRRLLRVLRDTPAQLRRE